MVLIKRQKQTPAFIPIQFYINMVELALFQQLTGLLPKKMNLSFLFILAHDHPGEFRNSFQYTDAKKERYATFECELK